MLKLATDMLDIFGGKMDDYEPYSVRNIRLTQGDEPKVYQYDVIPSLVRGQTFTALLLTGAPRNRSTFWDNVETTIVSEHGLFGNIPVNSWRAEDRVANYLNEVEDVELFLDVVEIGFREAQRPYVQYLGREHSKQIAGRIRKINDAIDQLNLRFRQQSFGYSFMGFPGYITRVDLEYMYAEAVKPTADQLSSLGWQGPLEEFLAAHQYYRHGDYKGAMNEALKAFESTMKSILSARQLDYEKGWQARQLINAMFSYGLIPSSLESFFNGIRIVLESGVPMLRNKQSGHGQGAEISDVPEYMAAYTLHLTASNILFLLSVQDSVPMEETL